MNGAIKRIVLILFCAAMSLLAFLAMSGVPGCGARKVKPSPGAVAGTPEPRPAEYCESPAVQVGPVHETVVLGRLATPVRAKVDPLDGGAPKTMTLPAGIWLMREAEDAR